MKDRDFSCGKFKSVFNPLVRQLGLDLKWLNEVQFNIFKKNGEAVDDPFGAETPFTFKVGDDVTIDINWEFSIDVYPFGAGIKTTKGKTKYGTVEDSSSTPFEDLFAAVHAIIPRTKETTAAKLFISEDTEFSSANLFLYPRSKINVYVLHEVQSYSDIVLANLLQKVNLGFTFGKQVTSLSEVFDALPNERLLERVEQLPNTANEEIDTRMKENIIITHKHLSLLNDSYQPCETLSEAGRRLIINDIVIAVAHAVGTKWEVEKSLFTSTHKGEMGWGPLDFFFDEHAITAKSSVKAVVVTKAIVDEEEITLMEETLEKAANSHIFPNAEEEEEEEVEKTIQSMLAEVEAKKASSIQGLAQMGAQLYDIGMKSLDEDSTLSEVQIRGSLSTGRMWRFFTMIVRRDCLKGLLLFDGQLALHVIKGLIQKQQPSELARSRPYKKAKTGKRFSGTYSDENVSEEQVKCVIKALVASILVPPEEGNFAPRMIQ